MAACSACGAETESGTCASCGASRAFGEAPTKRPPRALVPGSELGRFRIVRIVGAGTFVVEDDRGDRAVVAIADESLARAEADALAAIGGETFPRLVGRSNDEEHGPFLVLRQPLGARVPLAEATLDVAGASRVVEAVLGAIELAEAKGFAFEPDPSDVLVGPDDVRFARLRGATRLPEGARADARGVLLAIGAAMVPDPAVRAPCALVRLLVPGGLSTESLARDVDAVRAELAAPPAGPIADGDVAALTDPGLWRPYDQDAAAIARGDGWAVLVACDGVSSSSTSGPAARTAAKTARDALAHFARSGDLAYEPIEDSVAAAIEAAHLAVCADHAPRPGEDVPGTTIVVALVSGSRVAVGWVGDSRAYLVGKDGGVQITRDHSWVCDVVASGIMSEAEARLSPEAHAITRCLGPLEDRATTTPDVVSRSLDDVTAIVLCTDGLWTYLRDADDLAAIVRDAGEGATAADVAQRLVATALVRGGDDNVGVAVMLPRVHAS